MDKRPDKPGFLPRSGIFTPPRSVSHDGERHEKRRSHESAPHQPSPTMARHAGIDLPEDDDADDMPQPSAFMDQFAGFSFNLAFSLAGTTNRFIRGYPVAPVGHHPAPHSGHHAVQEALVCESSHYHTLHEIAHRCHLASICILVLFLLELFVKMWLDPKEFFSSKTELADFTIVTVSLAVDIFLLFRVTSGNYAWIPLLLVLCRFWRIVRVTHAVVEIIELEANKRLELEQQLAEIQSEIASIKGSGVRG